MSGHDLVCDRAGAERTGRHEGLFLDSFQQSDSMVEVEPRASSSEAPGDKEDSTRSHRGDLKVKAWVQSSFFFQLAFT